MSEEERAMLEQHFVQKTGFEDDERKGAGAVRESMQFSSNANDQNDESLKSN